MLQEVFLTSLSKTGTEALEPGLDRFNQPGWVNVAYTSDAYRRAHVDVVDARETKGLLMMHVCIFPHITNDGPVFGFDVIAGKNKMTGAFHDFSPTVNAEHKMIEDFGWTARQLAWQRERELPYWAKQIFTEDMIAAGNVKEVGEIDQLVEVVVDNLDYYLRVIGEYNGRADERLGAQAQNRYAHWQRQNPHTPKTMKALGLDEDDVDTFIEKCLFPNVEEPK
jgi:phycocyanobilin:ferredoxin oxidoreductase